MLWGGEDLVAVAARRRRLWPGPGGPADAHARHRGDDAGPLDADDPAGEEQGAAAGPGAAELQGEPAECVVGQRFDVCADLVGVRVHGVRDRRVRPADRGLEDLGVAGDRGGVGRVGVALDALEMAIWSRHGQHLEGLVHHSDRGGQYLAIRYTARLEEAGITPSVGSKGDSYDNALAETVNGLYKAELIRRRGPWRSVADVERATAEWVAWWNNQRLHGTCGRMTPAEYEAAWRQRQDSAA